MTGLVLVAKPMHATLADAEGWHKGLSLSLVRRSSVTGSVALFGKGGDVDILVDVGSKLNEFRAEVLAEGWVVSAGYDIVDEADWFSARKGLVNLIVLPSNLYDLWERALVVCSYLVKRGWLVADDKQGRAVIHAVILGEAQQIDLMDEGML